MQQLSGSCRQLNESWNKNLHDCIPRADCKGLCSSLVYAVQIVFIFCMLCLKAALPSFQLQVLIAMRLHCVLLVAWVDLSSSVYVCVCRQDL
jgi:hypothetical protein